MATIIKYHNRKTMVYGITFDSRHEAERYCYLRAQQNAGIISGLELQKVYELIPAQKRFDKVVERAVKYVADFVYVKDGETIVEDAKGVKTKEYIIKRKLMLERYGLKIHEV